MLKICIKVFFISWVCFLSTTDAFAEENLVVKIGLNYPITGPYAGLGLDQWNAANLAVEEINVEGGILGKKVELIRRDTQSRQEVAVKNVLDLIEKENVKMIFGGASSGIAAAVGKTCQEKGILFFATLAYSPTITGIEGHRHTFRECYNSWMAAKGISYFLNEKFPKKKYVYLTADYNWGHATEASLRKFTYTEDKNIHKSILIPFPDAAEADFKKALITVKKQRPDVLVMVLLGRYLKRAIRLSYKMGLKNKIQIVVPNITLSMAESAGPEVMEGVMGVVPWCWQVPYQFNYTRGKEFVEKFADRFSRYPSSSGASAYTILYEYKAAVERVNSFEAPKIIRTLEGPQYKFFIIPPMQGHEYKFLKDRQVWRSFDHQSVQTVYVVRCKPADDVLKDRFGLDYFEIIGSLSGKEAARTKKEWTTFRKAGGKPPYLEPLTDK